MAEDVTAPALPQLSEILETLRQQMPNLVERHHVSYLGVFGSYVRDEQGPDSDLDVLVEFSKTPGFFRYMRLENELSDLLGIKVDLVLKKTLKPAIGKKILQEVVPV